MLDKRREPEFDPRSPVQAGRSPAPYFIAAVVGAVLVWTAQQYWLPDSASGNSNHELPAKAPQPGSLEAAQSSGDLRTVFTAEDYPATALQNREEGTVQAKLTIDPNGRVSACKVVRSSGYATLDNATCSILERGARFAPARDAAGKPIEDMVVTPPVRWQIEG